MSFLTPLAPILGGLSDSGIDMYQQHRQNERTDNQREEDKAMQLDFAKNGIRWKVEDAVAAGLHPLAAVGASGSTYTPPGIQAGGINPSHLGQDISRAARAGMTEAEKQLHDMTIREMESRVGENDARRDYYLSEAAKNRAPGTAAFPNFVGKPPVDQIQGQADAQISRSGNDPTVTAGDHPAWKKYEFMPGWFVDLLYSQEGPAESLEGLGSLGAALGRNLLHTLPKQVKEKKAWKHLKNPLGFKEGWMNKFTTMSR